MSKKLLDRFNELIVVYMEENKCTISSLAQLAGIGNTTLRRILQNETEPSLSTVIALLNIVSTTDETISIIKDEFPQYLDIYTAVLKGKVSCNTDVNYLIEFNNSLREPLHCYIIHLAATKKGTTTTDVVKRFGQAGETALNDLIKNNILEQKGETIFALNQEFSISDCKIAKKTITNMIECSDVKKKNIVTMASESVNDEGWDLLKKALIDYMTKINEIRRNPRFQGNISFFAATTINEL